MINQEEYNRRKAAGEKVFELRPEDIQQPGTKEPRIPVEKRIPSPKAPKEDVKWIRSVLKNYTGKDRKLNGIRHSCGLGGLYDPTVRQVELVQKALSNFVDTDIDPCEQSWG
jgi:hypothetical protein